MNYTLVFRKEAERDLMDIQDYYNKILPSISDNFFKEFFWTINFVKDAPKLFQVRYRGVRIAPLHQFPYGVHYKETKDKITVYRVLHTKRYFK